MLKPLQIEFQKLRNSRYFWVLGTLFLIFMVSLPIATNYFLDYITGEGAEFAGISANQIPLFDFVDIWQNLTYIYSIFSVFLGFIVVVSISNEYSYTTMRQNIIDGMSRNQFLLSKIYMIIALGLAAAIAALIVGLCVGYMWSPVTDFEFVVRNIEFVGAYFLQMVGFLLFCLCVAMLIKRSGITIALLIFYVFMVEPIAVQMTKHGFKLPWLADLYPVSAIGNIIPNPYPKYILQQVQDYVGMADFLIWLAYAAFFAGLSFWLMNRRDV